MGGVYNNKALLLDEREIEEFVGLESSSFDDLCECATDFAEDRLGNWDRPWVEVLGCSSERFNTAALLNDDYQSRWVLEKQGWSQTVNAIASDLCLLDTSLISKILEYSDPTETTSEVLEEIADCLADDDFSSARSLVTSLENLKWAGLPCFKASNELTSGGDEDAYDLRRKDYGAGRRVVVEMAFVWE